MLNPFRTRRERTDQAFRLYGLIVRQARQSAFYGRLGVPDTFDGRFDVVALHAWMVLRRLRGEENGALAQAVFDVMMEDFDENLREIGVGDMTIGKKVKQMAKAFYGRVVAYDQALADEEPGALAAALHRNLFRDASPAAGQVEAIAGYVRRSVAGLDALPVPAFRTGEVAFPLPMETLEDGGVEP